MLQTHAVEPNTFDLLKTLMTIQAIDPFFLVGGTALALQFGHRTSIDLDLFTTNEFQGSELIDSLNNRHLNLTIVSEKPSMLITYINNVKVDFVKMGYPILFEPHTYNGIRMLDIRDIAPMKLKAIAQRGSKKDFYDVYFLLNKLTLEEMLNLSKKNLNSMRCFTSLRALPISRMQNSMQIRWFSTRTLLGPSLSRKSVRQLTTFLSRNILFEQ